MKIAKVILDIQTNSLSEAFSYVLPDDSKFYNENYLNTQDKYLEKIPNHKDFIQKYTFEIGCLVVVPFGSQIKCGFIIEIEDVDDNNFVGESYELKPALLAASKSYFTFQNVLFAKYISKNYLSPFATCLRLFVPSGAMLKIKKQNKKWLFESPKISEVDDRFVVKGKNFESYVPKTNAIKQKLIIDVLKTGDIKALELSREYGSISSTLKTLENKEVIEVIHKRRFRTYVRNSKNGIFNKSEFTLTDSQKYAYNRINQSIQSGKNDVYVLDGVTGSGKTEVYLRLIKNVIDNGKTACVLVPEISLTAQTVARFTSRFGEAIAVLHSKMSQGEKYDSWDYIKKGHAKVVIGARSALFSPLQNIGLIVIDEEHESTYKQDSTPRYLANDCAVWLAKQHNAVLILGSATPSIESLHNCKKIVNWHRIELNERTNNKPMPEISIVDMGNEFKSGYKSLFSQKLKKSIIEELNLGHKVILLHNRRGYANYMFCRNCGYKPVCTNCSTSLTYHQSFPVETIVDGRVVVKNKEMLVCHHCGHLEAPPVACPECGSPYIAKLGAGTQNVEEQLQILIQENIELPVNIVRMDADTTRKKFGHQKCLENFAKPGPAVLLGTQMIAKGLDFDDVTLVGVILIDTNLGFPDFRASEKTHNLILQVAGRAGRANLPGKVIVQTYSPDDSCIKYAANYSREAFLNEELMKRKMLNFPPFCKLVNIVISGFDENTVKVESKKLENSLSSFFNIKCCSDYEIMPSTACVLSKIRGKYRHHVLIKSKEDNISSYLSEFISTYKKNKFVNIQYDIDPRNMF